MLVLLGCSYHTGSEAYNVQSMHLSFHARLRSLSLVMCVYSLLVHLSSLCLEGILALGLGHLCSCVSH